MTEKTGPGHTVVVFDRVGLGVGSYVETFCLLSTAVHWYDNLYDLH